MTMTPTHWTCPVCRAPLALAERSYRCEHGHTFDRAKEGYVNLLLASQKRSAEPGDARAMLRSRREFLECGYYAALAEALAARCRAERQARGASAFALLDLGCGEGYYAGRIAAALAGEAPRAWVGGIDIARDGVRMAARRYADVDFAVASTARLPVADASLDLAVSVFAPTDPAEIRRTLRPDGIYLRVTPGPRHLFELRTLIYDDPREHEAPPTVLEGLAYAGSESLSFPLAIAGEGDVARLLHMTPYYWQADPACQQSIQAMAQLATQADFRLDRFRA